MLQSINPPQRKRVLILLICINALFVFPGILIAKEEPTEPVKSVQPLTPEIIEEKLKDLNDKAARFVKRENEESAAKLGISLGAMKERTEIIRETIVFLNRQLTSLNKKEVLAKEKKAVDEKIATGEALSVGYTPPYPIKIYESFFDRYTDNNRKKKVAEVARSIAKKAVATADDNVKELQQKKRLLQLQKSDEAADASRVVNWDYALLEFRESLAQEMLTYHKLAYENASKELEIAETSQELSQKLLASVRKELNFTEKDFSKISKSLNEKEKKLQKESSDLLKKLEKYEVRVRQVRKDHEELKDGPARATKGQMLAAAEYWRQAYQTKLEHNEATQQLLVFREHLWEYRYKLASKQFKRKELSQWRKEALIESDRLQKDIYLQQKLQTDILVQLGRVEEKISSENNNWELKKIYKDQKAALSLLMESKGLYLKALGTTGQLMKRLFQEIDQVQKQIPIGEWVVSLLNNISSLWHYELFAAENQSVTLGKIIIAVAIFWFGLFISGIISRMVQRHLIAIGNVSESSAAIAEKMTHYTLLLFVVFFAMRTVKIPLTAFTFLGGALAIGVGFGARKLINNFISGFILMAEKPVKVGDLIEMDTELGWVEEIGVRSTRVKTLSNISILVPNSFFLENNITNWTHNDNKVRCCITVGIMYGSPTTKARDLLIETAKEHRKVHKKPVPFVWFSNFGEHALIFDLFFFITISAKFGRQQVESDVRFMIEEKFRQSGIVIAYPQQDLHIDVTKPVQMETVEIRNTI